MAGEPAQSACSPAAVQVRLAAPHATSLCCRHHVYPAALTLSPTPKTTPSHPQVSTPALLAHCVASGEGRVVSPPQGHDVQLLLQEIQRAERWIEESRDLV